MPDRQDQAAAHTGPGEVVIRCQTPNRRTAMPRTIEYVTGYTAWVRSGAEPPGSCVPEGEEEQALTVTAEVDWPEWDGAIALYCQPGRRFAIMRFYHVGKPLPRNGYRVSAAGERIFYMHSPMASYPAVLALIGQRVKLHAFFEDGNPVAGIATETQQPLIV